MAGKSPNADGRSVLGGVPGRPAAVMMMAIHTTIAAPASTGTQCGAGRETCADHQDPKKPWAIE